VLSKKKKEKGKKEEEKKKKKKRRRMRRWGKRGRRRINFRVLKKLGILDLLSNHMNMKQEC
jgi:hypothetical protein